MNDIGVTLIISAVFGALLGASFFGALLWTVKRGLYSRRPALIFFFSYLLRMGCLLLGFYWISSGHWARLLASFIGFLLVRFFFTVPKEEKNGS